MCATTTSLVHGGRDGIINSFEVLRQELDAHNDRRDRLINLTRDVTNLSKKVIFLLHRIASEEIKDERDAISSAVQQSREKFAEIVVLFEQMRDNLQGENFWRLQKTVSGGIQEYIEAVSFAHYLEHKTLITFQQVQDGLKSRDGTPLFPLGLSCSDYLLGVADLTGELMRFAITSIGRHGMISKDNFNKAMEVCSFVRACKSGLEAMTPYIDELKSKQVVTTSSLKKIEETAYSVAIRGIESANLHHLEFKTYSRGNYVEDIFTEREDE